MTAWLEVLIVWAVIVTAPSGQESLQAVYATEHECVAALSTVQVPQDWQVECRARYRASYGG